MGGEEQRGEQGKKNRRVKAEEKDVSESEERGREGGSRSDLKMETERLTARVAAHI